MSDPLTQMQMSLAELQREVQGLRGRLDTLEKFVSVEVDEAGVERVYIECTDFTLRPAHDRRFIAIQMGAQEDGGYLGIHYLRPEFGAPAILLGMEHDLPHIQLKGRDFKPRVDLFIEEDCGLAAMFNGDGAPGVVMRARRGGGSVAVLQPDGRARGVLMHEEGEAGTGGKTDLIFATDQAETILKLHADAGGGLLTMGPPGQPDAASMVARGQGPAVLLHSPESENSVSMMAAAHMAEVCVHRGHVPGDEARTSLMAGDFGSSLVLYQPNGERAVDISAFDGMSTLTLNDAEANPCVVLSHHHGSHSNLTLCSQDEKEGVRLLAGQEVSSMEVKSPLNEDTKVIAAVTGEKPLMMVLKNKRGLLMLGEGEQGGFVCTYGLDPEKAGMATLTGGPVAGGLVLATMDGTAQLTLDATDQGGRLMINNDLGFQRIAMGVHQESAGIHLNNTGSMGVQAIATPKGGVLIVSDTEGNIVATLPEREEDDTDSWGELPSGF